jgi:hypothetical protein
MDPVRSFFLVVPYPVVTTTSPSVEFETTSFTSIDDLPSIETSCVAKPTEEITRVVVEEGTESLNVPSVPVEVPVELPLAVTETPGIADPSFESVILPVITFSCEKPVIEINNKQGKTIALSNLSQYISRIVVRF